ncbi:MAG TPA: type 4a pilus biogenesis protein PilO [Syntrophobacteria bacterium]|nr:type 4a pilus biogenesis protein PilO [Syntrophobacteria bacterium]
MALDMKKGLGGIKLPALPWGRLAKLSKLHKILILVATLGALGAGYFWWFYLPQSEQIEQLQGDLKKARAELDRLRRVAQDLRAFKKEYKEVETRFTQALQLLPDKEEIPTLLASISKLGADSGLEFLLFQPQPDVPRSFYAEIPLRLEVSGQYHNVAVFFDRVSKLSRIVNIGSVTMTPSKRLGDDVILTTGCTATTYKFIEPPPEGQKGPPGQKQG